MTRPPLLALAVALLSLWLVESPVAGQTRPAAPPTRPVADLNRAVVFSINESISDERGLALAGRVPSDLLIRGWFKWHEAPDWAPLAHLPARAHEMGALFGGGVTCSALYRGENGLSDDRVGDMATRGAAGELVDAWKTRGCLHGTLSNPRYIDYVLSWCFKQIDAGADYLFMDEINAALHANEGFDDYSIRDFRAYLAGLHGDYAPADPRWREVGRIDPTDRSICPDGTVASFDYRAYLKKNGWTAQPHAVANPLAGSWAGFRQWRDDRAWQRMTDEIRAYARARGRAVYISGNGLASRVDLQVLGVWGLWRTTGDTVDFASSQISDWAAIARAGRAKAGRKVPVVFFHDWGFGGFPYLKVSPAQRTLWNRIRGAEIYAAGAFYAFPVHGPFGCDASRDGTIDEMARQASFYRRNKSLYLDAEFRGIDCVAPADPLLSASLWTGRADDTVMVHVINRKVVDSKIAPRREAAIELPTGELPRSVRVVSPDWEGPRQARVVRSGAGTRLILPALEAYAVAVLEYDARPTLKLIADRIVLAKHWSRPAVSQFKVDARGMVDPEAELNGILQGRLHEHMANPPTFAFEARSPAKLSLQVQAVATQGARLELLIDGKLAAAHDLPDRDGKNETDAAEYDSVIDLVLPAGAHRVTVQNTGKDWASIRWLRFEGDLADVP